MLKLKVNLFNKSSSSPYQNKAVAFEHNSLSCIVVDTPMHPCTCAFVTKKYNLVPAMSQTGIVTMPHRLNRTGLFSEREINSHQYAQTSILRLFSAYTLFWLSEFRKSF